MAKRKAHGDAAKRGNLVVIEGLPVDELPCGIPAPPSPVPLRNSAGQLMASPGTTELARIAGLAAGEARLLERMMGFAQLPEDGPMRLYLKLAHQVRDSELDNLRDNVGGGSVPPGAASMVATAALELAASRYLYDRWLTTGDDAAMREAGTHADRSKQTLLAAHELTVKQAKGGGADNALFERQQEFQRQLAARQGNGES